MNKARAHSPCLQPPTRFPESSAAPCRPRGAREATSCQRATAKQEAICHAGATRTGNVDRSEPKHGTLKRTRVRRTGTGTRTTRTNERRRERKLATLFFWGSESKRKILHSPYRSRAPFTLPPPYISLSLSLSPPPSSMKSERY